MCSEACQSDQIRDRSTQKKRSVSVSLGLGALILHHRQLLPESQVLSHQIIPASHCGSRRSEDNPKPLKHVPRLTDFPEKWQQNQAERINGRDRYTIYSILVGVYSQPNIIDSLDRARWRFGNLLQYLKQYRSRSSHKIDG